MIAAGHGQTQVTKTLIRHAADVNAKSKVFCQFYIVI